MLACGCAAGTCSRPSFQRGAGWDCTRHAFGTSDYERPRQQCNRKDVQETHGAGAVASPRVCLLFVQTDDFSQALVDRIGRRIVRTGVSRMAGWRRSDARQSSDQVDWARAKGGFGCLVERELTYLAAASKAGRIPEYHSSSVIGRKRKRRTIEHVTWDESRVAFLADVSTNPIIGSKGQPQFIDGCFLLFVPSLRRRLETTMR
ncbi:hypothetical protein IWZ00DRAFT_157667 [Phyllosticta capitalensis]|uniref:Uncharacterized protein n=1 Tax=Phyllosticta capitalensis TaxID=121624 RepID=A0ABR1YZI5_9PEZI